MAENTVRRGHSDEQIAAVLQEAAQQHGEPLSVARYDSAGCEPSSSRIIQRFGSWNAACTAAGLSTTASARRYSRTWNAESATAAVARYLASPGATGSYAGYARWARTAEGTPSAQTVRNVLGSWANAKTATAEGAAAERHRGGP